MHCWQGAHLADMLLGAVAVIGRCKLWVRRLKRCVLCFRYYPDFKYAWHLGDRRGAMLPLLVFRRVAMPCGCMHMGSCFGGLVLILRAPALHSAWGRGRSSGKLSQSQAT